MISVSDVASLLNGKLEGDSQAEVSSICSVANSRAGAMAIVLSKSDSKHLGNCKADIIVGPPEVRASTARTKIILEHLDAQRLNQLLRFYKVKKYRLDDQENVSTFPGVHIAKHAKIGKDCYFMPGVRIMNGVVIGDNVAIHANTVIKEGTIIGNNVTIDSNNSIGNYSFEYMLNAQKAYERVESVGRVIIEDDVEIGSNNTIDRGTLSDTIIGRGTKLDNLIQIGHDSSLGKHCLMISQSGIAGHTHVGNRVIIHGQVAIAGHLTIGDNSVIKGKSGVSKSCPANSELIGYPARDTKTYLRSLAALNELARQRRSKPRTSEPAREVGLVRRWLDRLFPA